MSTASGEEELYLLASDPYELVPCERRDATGADGVDACEGARALQPCATWLCVPGTPVMTGVRTKLEVLGRHPARW
jgi:hypothetical protein